MSARATVQSAPAAFEGFFCLFAATVKQTGCDNLSLLQKHAIDYSAKFISSIMTVDLRQALPTRSDERTTISPHAAPAPSAERV
jgi:hypothetical protein